jgi:hypothetical protein
MIFLKPSIAKLCSIPAFFLLLVYIYSSIYPEENILFPLDMHITLYIIGILIAYFLSCSAWHWGNNHRPLLIVGFTLLTFILYFILLGVYLSYFSIPPTTLVIPCPVGHSCPTNQNIAVTTDRLIISLLEEGVPIFILLFGTVVFIREIKKSSTKKTS